MQWFEVENPASKLPKWKCTVGLSGSGAIFVPAAIAGSESNVFLCTYYDGTPSAQHLNHIYVPADWLSREFPETAELCQAICKSICEIIA